MKTLLSLWMLISFVGIIYGQSTKKELTHDNLIHWNRISNDQFSNNGEWIIYELQQEKGDNKLRLHNLRNDLEVTLDRAYKAKFSADNLRLFAMVAHPEDSIMHWKRSDVSKDNMPKDSLLIIDLENMGIKKVAQVLGYKIPTKGDSYIAYHLAPMQDTADRKKENKKNGSKLVIVDFVRDQPDTIPFVKSFELAEEGQITAFETSGDSGIIDPGVYTHSAGETRLAHSGGASYKKIHLSKSGLKLAFLMHADTSQPRAPKFDLMLASSGDEASAIASAAEPMNSDNWIINAFQDLSFSEDESRLYYGISPMPVLQDTALTDDEIVQVEVWNWKDEQLYTQQENRLKQIKEKAYSMVYLLDEQKSVQLGSKQWPNIRFTKSKNADYALLTNPYPYWSMRSWEASPARNDAAIIHINTGAIREIGVNIKGNLQLSPAGKFVFWWDALDTSWTFYNIADQNTLSIKSSAELPFEDLRNDRPMLPFSYGWAGWTKEDLQFWVYGANDIWSIDPSGKENPKRITNGYTNDLRWRWFDTDPEEPSIDLDNNQYLAVFNNADKQAGIARFGLDGNITMVQGLSAHRYRRLKKAKDAELFSFTRESFEEFGNLHTTSDWKSSNQLSDANPQQSDYKWGKVDLYNWTDLNGNALQGLLVTPEDFDPSKQYPLLVNFYERSTDGLHTHRAPYPHRSTINYAFYVSKGYIIFNPDVPYRIGYPGESALNAVLSGVTALVNEGFIDRKKIGVQGHSWGGYQVAHLLTKTDIFACAESGAPVVNMFSAYGGIRWGSGLSRMFQYEQTQSRIGGTIWEYPIRYLENSPLFFLDKVNTPVLIMHNDKDGAVPWYQGIEYFVGLRRLGKPCWMLNYNDEPHWPMKIQNRIDFNIRMQQFFDHFLMDQPMPVWMDRGVPAVEKGILQGLELTKE